MAVENPVNSTQIKVEPRLSRVRNTHIPPLATLLLTALLAASCTIGSSTPPNTSGDVHFIVANVNTHGISIDVGNRCCITVKGRKITRENSLGLRLNSRQIGLFSYASHTAGSRGGGGYNYPLFGGQKKDDGTWKLRLGSHEINP